jgi:hypothetical protein
MARRVGCPDRHHDGLRLARRLGVRESTVRLHRLKLGIQPFSGKQKVSAPTAR